MEEIKIVYESGEVLVINKPAGMVVNRAESVKGETVADWAEKRLSKLKSDVSGEDGELFKKRSGIAHRLDKETSGCLIIAKSKEALIDLLRQFKERKTKKEYLALVHGKIEPKEGEIYLPMRRSRVDRKKFMVSFEGKKARTRWKVEERYVFEGGNLTLVRLFPVTGRTHQIRVHMTHLGYPLFSDEKYLNRKKMIIDRQLLGRHFLHAAKISFRDPGTGEKIVAEAVLGEDLKRVLGVVGSH